jgi:DNA-binding response OmpR family regulator
MRILVLDDQPNFAPMLALGLSARGFSVVHFVSPQDALAHIQTNDALLRDLD